VIGDFVQAKRGHAAGTPSPKLFVFAGSNALFSHRCETLEAELGRPCTNLGIARGVGLDYLFSAFEPVMRPGDIVYMPLEYDWYLDGETARLTGPDAALMAYGDKARLWEFGGKRVLYAAFHFDLPFMISGLTEMALEAAGYRRRVGLATTTPQGDEKDHTEVKAAQYRDFIARLQPFVPSPAELAGPSDAKRQIAGFLRRSRERGVLVIGGLPTTFDDVAIGDEVITALRGFYESEGQRFLVLDTHSQYPRRCFFDTAFHLSEPWQIAHSRRLAAALRPFLNAAEGVSGRTGG
jgi:hypothetical protein